MKLVTSCIEYPIGSYNPIPIAAELQPDSRGVEFRLDPNVPEHIAREFKALVRHALDRLSVQREGVCITVVSSALLSPEEAHRIRGMWKELPHLAVAAAVTAAYELMCPTVIRAPACIPAMYLSGHGHPLKIAPCRSTQAVMHRLVNSYPTYWPHEGDVPLNVLSWLAKVWHNVPTREELWPNGLYHRWTFNASFRNARVGRLDMDEYRYLPTLAASDRSWRLNQLGVIRPLDILQEREVRCPHFTASYSAMAGSDALLGEFDLAHGGCFVVDELDHWSDENFEALLQTIETKKSPATGRECVFRVVVGDSAWLRSDPIKMERRERLRKVLGIDEYFPTHTPNAIDSLWSRADLRR